MTAIADSSFVIAVANKDDRWHKVCLAIHKEQPEIYLPQTTLTEVSYVLTRAGGNRATVRFLVGLPQSKYRLTALEPDDIRRTGQLLEQYADSRVDFVDATIAAVAERLGITRVLTVDRRDFDILRPRHASQFEILP